MPVSSFIARKEFAPRAPSKVVKILLVEDCKSDVLLLERMLEDVAVNCFYEITDVPRLVDAFYKIDREIFDLVMLDLNLIDIDGVASVAALRAQAPSLPIVERTLPPSPVGSWSIAAPMTLKPRKKR